MLTIKNIREQNSLTQRQLSELTGIPKRTIENWEQGTNEPKSYIINLINEFVNIKLKGAK